MLDRSVGGSGARVLDYWLGERDRGAGCGWGAGRWGPLPDSVRGISSDARALTGRLPLIRKQQEVMDGLRGVRLGRWIEIGWPRLYDVH